MNIDKIREIFSDEVFVKSLFELKTASEVQVALKAKDLELTEEEALAIHELMNKIKNGEITKDQLEKLQHQAEDGELSEEALEHVSGGLGIIAGFIIWGICAAVLAGAGGLQVYFLVKG